MWRRSLTFRSREREEGYLKRKADRLLSGTIAVAAVEFCVCIIMCLRVVLERRERREVGRSIENVEKFAAASLSLASLLCLAMLLMAALPALHRRIGFAQREYLVVGAHVIIVFLSTLGARRGLSQLLGIELPTELSEELCNGVSGSEASRVLLLSILVMVTHFTLPIRWIVASAMEFAVVAFYGIVALGFRSCEQNGWYTWLLITMLTILTAFGKRQLEYAERRLVIQLVGEMKLRAEAEFSLSKTLEQPTKPDDAASSIMSPVGRIFSSVAQAEQYQLELKLEPLAEIGRREQWLLGAEELTVDSESRVLGTGGFGIVASGRWQRTPVALKFVKESTTSRSLADIGNELRVLRKIQHPNVILLHGACVDFQNGDIVLVLERVFGTSLDFYVDAYHANATKTMKSLIEGFELLIGVCRALVYLHAKHPPVVHGDLKGANIFVERRSMGAHAKLLDFGLARVLSRRAKPLGGTLRWAAPEVFTDCAPTPAADVFSFGRVIYFLLVGVRPLSGYDKRVIQRAAENKRVLPLEWPREPSVEVEWCRSLVEAAVVAKPECRPTIARVCAALEAVSRALWKEVAQIVSDPGAVGPQVSLSSAVSSGSDTSAASQQDRLDFWGKVNNLRRHVRICVRPPQEVAEETTSATSDAVGDLRLAAADAESYQQEDAESDQPEPSELQDAESDQPEPSEGAAGQSLRQSL